jgi:hypothetical protein
LAKKFNVRSAVIDIRPYEDKAREFQKQEPYKIFLCEYKEKSSQPTEFNEQTGLVKVDRTTICDTTHRLVAEKSVVFPRRCDEMEVFTKQLCGIAKVLEEDKKSGTKIYRYRIIGNAEDHYRHAFNYFVLAAQRSHKVVRGSHERDKLSPISDYDVLAI